MTKYAKISKEEMLENLTNQWGTAEFLIREKKTDKILKVSIIEDLDPQNPREWDNLCTITCRRGSSWDISDDGEAIAKEQTGEWLDAKKNDPNIYIMPVYMYDHGGQTISLAPFGDIWDSGICGYIWVTKEKVLSECMCTDDNWKEVASNHMADEIRIYNDYITGNTWQWQLLEPEEIQHTKISTGETWTTTQWNVVDSCCGYYGDIIRNGILDEFTEKDYDYIKEIKEEVVKNEKNVHCN